MCRHYPGIGSANHGWPIYSYPLPLCLQAVAIGGVSYYGCFPGAFTSLALTAQLTSTW